MLPESLATLLSFDCISILESPRLNVHTPCHRYLTMSLLIDGRLNSKYETSVIVVVVIVAVAITWALHFT